jgi:hypothetical protein
VTRYSQLSAVGLQSAAVLGCLRTCELPGGSLPGRKSSEDRHAMYDLRHSLGLRSIHTDTCRAHARSLTRFGVRLKSHSDGEDNVQTLIARTVAGAPITGGTTE